MSQKIDNEIFPNLSWLFTQLSLLLLKWVSSSENETNSGLIHMNISQNIVWWSDKHLMEWNGMKRI